MRTVRGRSWNRFIFELAVDHVNNNKELYRKVFYDEYREFRGTKCESCGADETFSRVGHYNRTSLVVHHIDNDITNNQKENLQTLCRPCHGKV